MQKNKILLLMDVVQGYSEEIKKNLERRGFQVDWYSKSSKIKKNNLTIFQRILRSIAEDFNVKLAQVLYFNLEKKYYENDFKNLKKDYDYIIDIGAMSSLNFMKIFNNYFDSRKILFIWDDLKYDKRSEELIEMFDEVFSYCPEDSEKYNLSFRPSFYLDCFKKDDNFKELDIFYIGSMREKNRTEIIVKFSNYTRQYKTLIKLVGKFKLRYIDRFLSKEIYKQFFIQSPYNLEQLANNYKNAKIILDITLKNQIGLGLRPIEAIGAKCKLITTNKNILKYDFYNANNIFILEKDFSNISLINDFIEKPYKEYSEEIKYKYSLDGFLEDVFKN